MSILKKRLQEALENGRKVEIEVGSKGWHGRIIYLDHEWVELLALTVDESDSGELEGTRQTWLIKLNQIDTMAYPAETWDAARLNATASTDSGEI